MRVFLEVDPILALRIWFAIFRKLWNSWTENEKQVWIELLVEILSQIPDPLIREKHRELSSFMKVFSPYIYPLFSVSALPKNLANRVRQSLHSNQQWWFANESCGWTLLSGGISTSPSGVERWQRIYELCICVSLIENNVYWLIVYDIVEANYLDSTRKLITHLWWSRW